MGGGAEQLKNIRKFSGLLFKNRCADLSNRDYYKVLDALFCCVLFRRDFVDRVGLLDENFTPAWFEDNDYSFRSILAGYNNYICNDVSIYHNYSKTSSKLGQASRIQERNRAYFFSKYNYLAQYCWENNLKYSKLYDTLSEIKSSPFYFIVAIDLKIRERFEKVFRGLIKRIR